MASRPFIPALLCHVPLYGSGHIHAKNIPDEKSRQVPDEKGYREMQWDRYRKCLIIQWQRRQNAPGAKQ
jgi:hypothetical protein